MEVGETLEIWLRRARLLSAICFVAVAVAVSAATSVEAGSGKPRSWAKVCFDYYSESSPSVAPWPTSSKFFFLAIAPRRLSSGATQARVCTRNENEGTKAFGPILPIPADEKLVSGTVAWPFVAWATSRRRSPSSHPVSTIHWRDLRKTTSRSFLRAINGSVEGLIASSRGDIATHYVSGRSERLVVDRVSQKRRTLFFRPNLPISRKGTVHGMRTVTLWRPGVIAITQGAPDAYKNQKLAPLLHELRDNRSARDCNASPNLPLRAKTGRLSAAIADSKTWSPDDNRTFNLEICDATGKRIYARRIFEGAAQIDSLTIAGTAVAVRGEWFDRRLGGSPIQVAVDVGPALGTSRGSISESLTNDIDQFVSDHQATVWQSSGKPDVLTISDALGVRRVSLAPQVPPFPGGVIPDSSPYITFTGVRLNLAPGELQATRSYSWMDKSDWEYKTRTNETLRLPLKPLAPADYAIATLGT